MINLDSLGLASTKIFLTHSDKELFEELERLAHLMKLPVDVVKVRGVNHLLVPAITGEPDEYASLSDLNVSKDVTSAVGAWLTRTLPPARR